jgi:aminobenzoyl-glutamate transport protein
MSQDQDLATISDQEVRGLKFANWTFLLGVILILALALPENAVLRDEHGLKPFYESLVPLIMLLFLACGIVYGMVIGNIKNDKDVAHMASEQMSTMGSYIVLAFVAAQFVAYFAWSNLGLVVAISGASFLKAVGFEGIPLIVSFIFVTSVVNLFIGSASAKWAIMGPVFIPMFMFMGYSPELIQNTYRIGDSVTNIISPLLPYFPIIIAFAKKYSPKMGIGTLISVMLPYSLWFLIFWTMLLSVWMVLGLPLGPGAPLFAPPIGGG